MKILKSALAAQTGAISGQPPPSATRRFVRLSVNSSLAALRTVGVAILITVAWLVLIGLGAAFWWAVIWLIAR
jgi:hypothetical protein